VKTDSTYSHPTSKHFASIDSGEYREKIRFVNIHRKDLKSLPLMEYLLVMDGYAEALFEMGRFPEHIKVADHLIELSILHNVYELGEKDLYFESLFQKAASLYNLERYDDSIYILKQLLGIKASNESCRLFLINCYVRKQAKLLNRIRSVSLVLLLSSAVVIAIELLLVRPIWPNITDPVEFTRNALFLSGAGMLIIGEVGVRYKAVSKMYDHVNR
jgi:tetratricopeptide (TPR) repeat protein